MDNGDTKNTIMVVDDTPANLKLLGDTLRKLSYRVLTFNNGEGALKAAMIEPPDLFLLDINMPGMNGFELCKKLKEDVVLGEVPVIFLSALTDSSDKVKAFQAGGVDYVTKPFHFDEVFARVATHLGLYKMRTELEKHVVLLDEANEELTEKTQLIEQQLAQAEKVQRALLPTVLPKSDRTKFHWRYEPCDLLAGDSLNIFQLDKEHIGMYLFDVTGHGVAAALLAVSVSRVLLPTSSYTSLVHTQDPAKGEIIVTPPAQVANELNRLFPWTPDDGHFFTLVYGILNTSTLEFRYINAGHTNPLHITPKGECESQRSTGLPIGLSRGVYDEMVIKLSPGSRLVIYSDGITEVMDKEKNLWGQQRFCIMLTNNGSHSIVECLDDVILQTDCWAAKNPILDDRTILGMEILNNAE